MAGCEDASVAAVRGGTQVGITHPDRVLYPTAGLARLDVIEYYLGVAPFLLPFLHGRPITMHRFPSGVGESGFFEKDAPAGTPGFVETFTHWTDAHGRNVDFVLCNNLDTLTWLANLAALELHATLARAGSHDSPDLLFVDIDPEPPFDFDEVIGIARIVREHLEERGLRPFVKTSGRKGLHVVVPLEAGHDFDDVREFAHGIGKAVARDTPHVVSEFTRSREKGTVFVDYLQNAPGKTMVAPYSLRATPEATVLRPEDYTAGGKYSRERRTRGGASSTTASGSPEPAPPASSVLSLKPDQRPTGPIYRPTRLQYSSYSRPNAVLMCTSSARTIVW